MDKNWFHHYYENLFKALSLVVGAFAAEMLAMLLTAFVAHYGKEVDDNTLEECSCKNSPFKP